MTSAGVQAVGGQTSHGAAAQVRAQSVTSGLKARVSGGKDKVTESFVQAKGSKGIGFKAQFQKPAVSASKAFPLSGLAASAMSKNAQASRVDMRA